MSTDHTAIITAANTNFDNVAPQPRQETLVPNEVIVASEAISEEPETFESIWTRAYDAVFSSISIVYLPLKDVLPTFENGVITLTAKNDFQKDQIISKTREIRHFFKSQANIEIDTVEVNVHKEMEVKTTMLDMGDKVKILKDINPELVEFVQILGLQLEE